MKRFLILLGAIAVIGLSSCNKEKDCTCVTSYSGTGSELMDDVTTEFTTEEECSDGNSTTTTMGLTATTECEEK